MQSVWSIDSRNNPCGESSRWTWIRRASTVHAINRRTVAIWGIWTYCFDDKIMSMICYLFTWFIIGCDALTSFIFVIKSNSTNEQYAFSLLKYIEISIEVHLLINLKRDKLFLLSGVRCRGRRHEGYFWTQSRHLGRALENIY